MKKRTKARTKKRTSKKEALVNWFKALSVAKKVLFVLATVFIGLVLFTVVSDRVDQWRLERDFINIEKSFQSFNLEKDGFKIKKGCQRTVEKFSDGSLFCSISISKTSSVEGDVAYKSLRSAADTRTWKVSSDDSLANAGRLAEIEFTPSNRKCALRLAPDNNIDHTSTASIICYSYSLREFF